MQFFGGGVGGRSQQRLRRKIPQNRNQLAAAKSPFLQFRFDLPPHTVLRIALLTFRNESRRILRRQRLLLDRLISVFQFRRNAIGVDPHRKMHGIGIYIVLKGEMAVEDMPPAAPAVFQLLRHPIRQRIEPDQSLPRQFLVLQRPQERQREGAVPPLRTFVGILRCPAGSQQIHAAGC